MKKKNIMGTSLIVGSFALLWKTIAFRQTQELEFQKLQCDYERSTVYYRRLKENESFFHTYRVQIKNLLQKGWMSPSHRLIAGNYLNTLAASFEEFTYQFEPELMQTVAGIPLRMTTITISLKAFLDVGIYETLELLPKKFPGVLRAKEITLTRLDNDPTRIRGKLVFEWIALEEERNGK